MKESKEKDEKEFDALLKNKYVNVVLFIVFIGMAYAAGFFHGKSVGLPNIEDVVDNIERELINQSETKYYMVTDNMTIGEVKTYYHIYNSRLRGDNVINVGRLALTKSIERYCYLI